MTTYERKGDAPTVGKFETFDHIQFWVSNAKQAAQWYCLRFGFEIIAYKGLETGSRDFASWVVQQGDIKYVLTSPLNPVENEIGKRIAIKGDAVKDVAFTVKDCVALYNKAMSRGAVSIQEPIELKDEHGIVVISAVKTYGDTVHSFVQRAGYKGVFMPGFIPVTKKDPLASLLPAPGLKFIDHCVGNQPDLEMVPVCDWYEKILDFHRFWSVDDKQIHTKYSSLRSIVMASYEENVKMPINEPAQGEKKSQIQEYVDYHGGAGVQHIAMNTSNILEAVKNMRARGTEFLTIPATYYADVKKRLEKSPLKVHESIDTLQELGILIDFDDQGYLLQLFTKPVQDRPTLFFEVIQRYSHQGFGAGNFKALFEAIERDQADRGNLENAPKTNGTAGVNPHGEWNPYAATAGAKQ